MFVKFVALSRNIALCIEILKMMASIHILVGVLEIARYSAMVTNTYLLPYISFENGTAGTLGIF